eukprot:1148945-Pelagomonas_calceolata.AAC.1
MEKKEHYCMHEGQVGKDAGVHKLTTFDPGREGPRSLFTMFLSAPVMAFCLSMGVTGPSTQQLKGLQVGPPESPEANKWAREWNSIM